MNPDRDHLKLLSIFHFLLGGLATLAAMFPVIHLALGIGLVSGFFPADTPGQGGPELIVGWIFVVLASLLILLFLVCAGLAVYTGVCLANEKRHGFCTAVACLECLFFPWGTVLGVVTLMVLMRPSVKELFGVAMPAAPPDSPAAATAAAEATEGT